VLNGGRRALAVAATVGGLYLYLYVLLTNEDYALLLGSLGLFAALAVTMFVTRHIDWYAPPFRASGATRKNRGTPEASGGPA